MLLCFASQHGAWYYVMAYQDTMIY